jgi:hypothetical protein
MTLAQINKYFFTIISIIITVLMFVFIAYKAYSMVFTGDEAASFYDIKYMNFAYLLGAIANSHLVNTLYIYPLVKLDIYNPFILRLANVLAFLLYAYGSFRLLKPIPNTLIAVSGFILLVTNPFLIDYFSLCRGYGLALGFMMLSLVYLIKFLEYKTEPIFLKFSVFGILCVWSNYAYLYFYLISFLLILFFVFREKSIADWFKCYKKGIVLNVLFSIITLPILYNLKKNGALWWGGNESFITDTIGSIIHSTQYFTGSLYSELLLYILFFLVVSKGIIFIFICNKKVLKYPVFIFFGVCILTIVFFHAFGNLYLYERTAIILIPLFCLMWVYIISEWKYFSIVLVIVCLFSGYHFIKTANPRYTFTYHPDSQVDEVVEDIKIVEKNNNREVNIASGFHFVSGINFYKDAKKYPFIQTVGFDLLNPAEGGYYYVYYNKYPNRTYNYFYFWKSDEWYFRRLYQFKIIKYYPQTKTCLAVATTN